MATHHMLTIKCHINQPAALFHTHHHPELDIPTPKWYISPRQPSSNERAPSSQPKGPYSTPGQESVHYSQTHVGGYGRPPPQPSHHSHYLTAEPSKGSGQPKGQVPARSLAPKHASMSQSASQSDILKNIDADIQNASSKMKESDEVEGQNLDIHFGPNLVYPKCEKHFRVRRRSTEI